MPVNFDFQNIVATEFGIGMDEDENEVFYAVPVDDDVQGALRQMAGATVFVMTFGGEDPPQYEPSETYEAQTYLTLPIGHDLAEHLRVIHEAVNLPRNADFPENAEEIFCYFARFTDRQGRRLTALPRASQFKGILESRLIRFVTDALRLVEDNVFKLDRDFDLLLDDRDVHILRYKSFEAIGKLRQAILRAVPVNVRAIQGNLPFVDFAPIQIYAEQHPRAAHYLASIRCQETRHIRPALLVRRCRENGIDVRMHRGQIQVPEGQVMDFLQVLDRRRYTVDLVPNNVERYQAASRRKV